MRRAWWRDWWERWQSVRDREIPQDKDYRKLAIGLILVLGVLAVVLSSIGGPIPQHEPTSTPAPPAQAPAITPAPVAVARPSTNRSLAAAKHAARRFLPGYLDYTYGLRDAHTLRPATTVLRARLERTAPRVAPKYQREGRRVIVESLQIDETAPLTAAHVEVLALIRADPRYTVRVTMEHDDGAWRASDATAAN